MDFEFSLYDYAGTNIAQLVRDRVPTSLRLLDVGAGWGKYHILLPEYEMEAVEVWEPEIRVNRLDAHYAAVYTQNINDFVWQRTYGATIFGDVLEHLPISQAQAVIGRACEYSATVLVAVPFEMPQHHDDNPYEEHVQADLNEELMAQRYPQLEFWGKDDSEFPKAIYVKKGSL